MGCMIRPTDAKHSRIVYIGNREYAEFDAGEHEVWVGYPASPALEYVWWVDHPSV